MAVKAKSRREKVGSGLGLLLGIIGFNLLVPFFFEMSRPEYGLHLSPT
ncbi:hypothetical protein [Aeromonas salmonicida]